MSVIRWNKAVPYFATPLFYNGPNAHNPNYKPDINSCTYQAILSYIIEKMFFLVKPSDIIY